MKIVWQMPDGSIRITTPCAVRIDGEAESAYLDRVAARTQSALPDLSGAVRLQDMTDAEHSSLGRQNRAEWGKDQVRTPAALTAIIARGRKP